MAPEEPRSRKWSADGLMNCSTEEIDGFINGGMLLPMSDWTAMPEDRRKHLLDRITNRRRELGGVSTPGHGSDISDEEWRFRINQDSGPDSVSAKSLPSEPGKSLTVHEMKRKRIFETADYNTLVEDGGRPLYPIRLLQDVSEHPERHSQLLHPWRILRPGIPTWPIFARQLAHWKRFRDWQRENRGLGTAYRQFHLYITRRKLAADVYFGDVWPDELDAKRIQHLHNSWRRHLDDREKTRPREKERGCETFSDHAEAIKRRLSQHDVTRPLDLKEDPFKQDTMTTWLEYLAYEYWTNEKLVESSKRKQQEYERGLKGLQESGTLEHGDTPEYIRDHARLVRKRRKLYRKQLDKDLESAKRELDLIYWPYRNEEPLLTLSKHLPPLRAAIEKLESARASILNYDKYRHYDIFFLKCASIKEAKLRLEEQAALTAWAKDQIPLIEAELAGDKTQKRSLEDEPAEEEGADQPSAKKQKVADDGKLSRRAGESRVASEEPAPPPLEHIADDGSDQATAAVRSNPQDEQQTAVTTPLPATSVLPAITAESVASEPVAQEPVIPEPVTQEPAAQELVVSQPVPQEPDTLEPAAQETIPEPVTQASATQEPVILPSVLQEPDILEQVVQETAISEPMVQESIVSNNNINNDDDQTSQVPPKAKARRRAKGAAPSRRSRRVAGQPLE